MLIKKSSETKAEEANRVISSKAWYPFKFCFILFLLIFLFVLSLLLWSDRERVQVATESETVGKPQNNTLFSLQLHIQVV